MKLQLTIIMCILNTLLLPTSFAKEKFNEINNFIQGFHDIKQFNGNVLVAQNGKVIFEKSFGYANFEWDLKNTAQSKFRIASMTKQFTSMLILQLVQEGHLKLQAPISHYLSDYRKDIGEKVTIHQLLNHTSGIPNYLRSKGFIKNNSRDHFTVDAFIKQFCSEDLEFEPGTKFRYSNSGYAILGKIIEQISKQSYQMVLKQKILAPLGMKNTGYDSTSAIIKNRVSGYEVNLTGHVNTDYLDMSIPYAAGSMYSTARDLMIWDAALYTQQLLDKTLTEKMYQVSTHRNYAYGWEVKKLSENASSQPLTQVNHSGAINGFNSSITRIIEDKYLIVLLNNTGGAPISAINTGITNILYGKKHHKAKKRLSQTLYEEIKKNGIKAAINTYTDLKNNGEEISEHSLNDFGYELMSIGLLKEAIEIFKLNTINFPESSNAYDSLAEAYLSNTNTPLALLNYKKSLALDENNVGARVVIERLK